MKYVLLMFHQANVVDVNSCVMKYSRQNMLIEITVNAKITSGQDKNIAGGIVAKLAPCKGCM